ncbi:Dephospho-CoA kinase [compost metagenome]
MLKIGITGGIGSGKSTVVKVFEQLGVPVFIADDQAKLLMNSDEKLIADIKQFFGEDVYLAKGELDRKKLASLVFNSPEKLKQLNGLVHPATIRAFDKWCKKYQNKPYILKEAAILFESGTYKQNDLNILVTAPEEMRIARVIKRDKSNEEQVRSRIKNQLPEEDKIKMADYMIVNDEQTALIPQIVSLHTKLVINNSTL